LDEIFLQETVSEVSYFTAYSLALIKQVDDELKRRGMTPKDLACKMGKQESEVSKWVSPLHNFALRSFTKLSAALGKN